MCTVCGTAPNRHHRAPAHPPAAALLLFPNSMLAVCHRELHAPLLLAKDTTGLEATRLAVQPWPFTQHNWAVVLQAEHSLELHLPYISYVLR